MTASMLLTALLVNTCRLVGGISVGRSRNAVTVFSSARCSSVCLEDLVCYTICLEEETRSSIDSMSDAHGVQVHHPGPELLVPYREKHKDQYKNRIRIHRYLIGSVQYPLLGLFPFYSPTQIGLHSPCFIFLFLLRVEHQPFPALISWLAS